ncbi:hypothetical protein ACFL4X_01760 [Gemmatimonadota bacterium]
MSNKLIIGEISIVVRGGKLKVSQINPDFLKWKQVVPEDWNLITEPLASESLAQVKFDNEISITATVNSIQFIQANLVKRGDKIILPELVEKYITLVEDDYRQLGINPKGHIIYGDSFEEVHSYLVDNFLVKGPWNDFGGGLKGFGFNMFYPIQAGQLTIKVEVRGLKSQGEKGEAIVPIILFESNFHREIKGDINKDKGNQVIDYISAWKSDLEIVEKFASMMTPKKRR